MKQQLPVFRRFSAVKVNKDAAKQSNFPRRSSEDDYPIAITRLICRNRCGNISGSVDEKWN